MIDPTPSPWLVPFEGKFDAKSAPCAPPSGGPAKAELQERLEGVLEELFREQRKLMAQDQHALLVVFQGVDACGKDGTTRAITRGLDAAGCRVHSFKVPSHEELDHDFLWRINRVMPERGTLGLFNRSHYEEVLVVKVEPDLLKHQRLPDGEPTKEFWDGRYSSIRDFERHAARNGTTIRKFWLNVSRDEQRQRFLERIEEKESRWKFSADDIRKREQRPAYLEAFGDALSETSRPWAPWYAVPADSKPYLRLTVAEILLKTLKAMDLKWPTPSKADRDEMLRIQKQLESDG